MKNYAFYLCFFFVQITVCQNYVYDLDTKSPIEAAGIYSNDGFWIITNTDGYFEYPKDKTPDSLSISHLSYTTKTVTSQELHYKDTIFLSQSPIILDQIVLRRFNAKDTVLKAIGKIDQNYIKSTHNTIGFYRQSLQQNDIGVEMLEVDFIGYSNGANTSTKILKARRSENYSKPEFKIHGGVVNMFENGDFVKNKEHFLDPNKLNRYVYEFEGQIPYQDLAVYKISFSPNSDNIETIRKGVMYIDSRSLAIVQVSYHYDKEKLTRISKVEKENTSAKNPSFVLMAIENLIRYKQLQNGKWALIYIKSYNLNKGLYHGNSNNYHLRAKLVINTIRTDNPVKVKTNYNSTKDFSKVIEKFDNITHWDDNYRLSLSVLEKKLLMDIQNQKK